MNRTKLVTSLVASAAVVLSGTGVATAASGVSSTQPVIRGVAQPDGYWVVVVQRVAHPKFKVTDSVIGYGRGVDGRNTAASAYNRSVQWARQHPGNTRQVILVKHNTHAEDVPTSVTKLG